MAENKTKPTATNVTSFLKKVKDNGVRKDCQAIIDLMKKASKEEPVMWGSSIVGFGSYHYKYESGREGDTIIIGFSPRKQNIAIYLAGGLQNIGAELPSLGNYTTGKGCLYIKSMTDVNHSVLGKIFTKAFKEGKKRNTV
jgi:hypothetical protein